MKLSAYALCCTVLLVLPCATLGAVVSKTNQKLTQDRKLKASGEQTFHYTPRTLRGGFPVSKVPASHSISALQASQATQYDSKKRVGSKGHHSRSWLQRRFRTKRMAQGHKQKQKVGICRGSKLRWWILIKKKCSKAFGKNSKWDRDRQDGKCGEAWNDCNTGFYAVCCTQPLGPTTMDAYCAKQNLTVVNASDNKTQDKACQVQLSMRGVKNLMTGIKNTVSGMDMMSRQAPTYGPGPSPGPAPMPAPAVIAPMAPPPGLMPMTRVAAAPAPAPVVLPALPSPLESRCAVLTELTRQASDRIKAIKAWAKRGGFQKPKHHHHRHGKDKDQKGDAFFQKDNDDDGDKQEEDVQSAEAADPDLFFTVKGVLSAGEKLDHMLKDGNFCSRGPEEEEEDDDDDVEDDLEKDPTEDWDDDDEDDEEPPVMQVNMSSILDLLNWESEMNNAVDKFEKDVHPHGFKWWRYRYEYTIVESIVLAFSVMVKYLVMWLLHGVSFFQVHKFYKTGLPMRFDRYAWGYFVFHAASLMVMVTTAYMLYIPWGKQNIFNIFAEAVHGFVDGQFNVPFLGYSWLYMVLDVQFQLFVTFALYSIFVIMVVSDIKKALKDWKTISEPDDIQGDSQWSKHNQQLYNHLDAIMKRRIANTAEYRQIFKDCKLTCSGVQDLDKVSLGTNEFKLHLYLTDGLGRAVEYLVEVSLTTNIFLAISALLVAVLAHHYQVAFMYFLPVFVVVGLVMFLASYFVSRHFRALSEKDDHNTPAKYVTVHSYSRAFQIMLYCVFFSFARLLLSNDIFEFYPMVYISALISLAVVLALLWAFAGRLIKETVCALILPPHLELKEFRKHLEQVGKWHTVEQCHECGALQLPAQASYSKEWAGKSIGERKAEPGSESGRLFSWRG